MMVARKLIPVAEVLLVLALFFVIRNLLKNSGFGDWQEPLFGRAIVSSFLLFFVLPLLFVFIGRRDPGSCGLTTENFRYHWRVALRAIAFVLPITALFPIIGLLGSEHKEWLGASILAVGFVGGGWLFAKYSKDLSNFSQANLAWKGVSFYVALLLAGLFLCFLLNFVSPLATRLVTVLIFVGFLEEFFFRGYVQSRLNDSFGRPFKFQTVNFGAGMILSAVVFGLFHPLTVTGDTPWAWAFWTFAGGLVFGFVREKTGAAIAPAMLHGAIWIPGVFFGPG